MALAPALGSHGGVYMPYQRVSAVRLQLQPVHHRTNQRPYTSFFIKDILGSKIGGVEPERDATTPCGPAPAPLSPASPWSAPAGATTGSSQPSPPSKDAHFPVRDAEKTLAAPPCGIIKKDANGSPLSALEELANKTFTGLETSILRAAEATVNGKRDPLHLFNRQPPRKKRKSRTAFNNQQIFELERRFLYQKYLTPADRDEIASVLGLTNAQVITWFQNRRAKLKRDMEELTMDVTVTSKKCAELNLTAEESTGPTSASAAPTVPPARLKEEEGGDEDDDDEDRLSTASEQQQCREQYSLRLASADDNSQRRHHDHRHHPHQHHLQLNLNTDEQATPSSSGSEPSDCSEGNAPGNAEAGSTGDSISGHGMDAASCMVSNAVAETDGEEEESMDCSTSPSSSFHSESEEK
ncbi:transcription factor LBX1-like isoform X2 [Acanthaster planci]|uniref:Transcription factor LBX1-like isoform X2 n=1 Tax=Acanthaster planci TaxID=133434 RepID=A0A8B7YY94_ACAPL|nr:transcription factor LBX1-like isoform X2 [Acanthaster planci]